jgi:hypothetical protein
MGVHEKDMVPRRRQRGFTIRSDRALARLALLTGKGMSQARVVEEALDRMPLPSDAEDRQNARRRIDAIIAKGAALPKTSMSEMDSLEYDDDGNCR